MALRGVAKQLVEASHLVSSDINARIGGFLACWRKAAGRSTDIDISACARYVALQGALYGRRQPPEPAEVELEHIQVQPEMKSKPSTKSFVCLLCMDRLKNRFSLTRHTMKKHLELLSRQHRCPKCSADIIAGADKWCAHVEKFHSHETVAPNIPTVYVESTRSLRSRPCLMDLSV